jgi:malonate-semialdehyde dehydrogenase (acetylating)/methylmalonate-semialdehyde dehydrogenase
MDNVQNYVGGQWAESSAQDKFPVHDPATGEQLALTPLSCPDEVEAAARAAADAFPAWRRTPPGERRAALLRLQLALQAGLEDIAATITRECGKTLEESRGEMRRAIENLEEARAAHLLQGSFSEDVAAGIDEYVVRQPLGVSAMITPFNFPAMVPFWFFPYALASGNTCIVKPSERVPLTMQKVFRLAEAAGLPPGVLNLVNGGRETAEALLRHPAVRTVSFVGSTPAARDIYREAAAQGKRVQAQGGARNAAVIMPDADIGSVAPVIAESAFGCAGQRCLATSVAVVVGEARERFLSAVAGAAACRRVGPGLDPQSEMGPVISPESKTRILSLIDRACAEGATLVVDGREGHLMSCEGNFLRPTVLRGVSSDGTLARTEVFGPVLSVVEVDTLDEALGLVNAGRFGNQATLFTQSGKVARRFRYEAQAGNIGINVGVAAPVAAFPFSGWKDSFFGDLHGQGQDAFDFFTQKKVVIERWLS